MSIAAVLADNPLAFYLLDEGPGDPVAVDASPNGRDGVHINDPYRLGCASSYGPPMDTEFGNAALVLPLTAGTWEAYLWMNEYEQYGLLRDHSGTPPGDNGWLLYGDNSGGTPSGVVQYRVGGTEFTTTVPSAEIKQQRWVHLAITYDATQTRYFVDGVLRHTGAGPASAPSPPGPAYAAVMPWHAHKNGELPPIGDNRAARVAFFDVMLSDARIALHATDPPCAGWFVGPVRY